MPRSARTRIAVESEGDPGIWSSLKDDFSSVPEAVQWIKSNIGFGDKLRVAKISGVFVKTALVVKK